MSCSKVDSSLLQDLLDETIDPLEKIFLENHLNTCKDCRRELSELKLMYWDLGNKANYEIEYPDELDAMGELLIDAVIGEEARSNTMKIVDMQFNALKMSGKYLEYIPGANYTSQVLKKASNGLAKGVKKMLNAK
jgi:hypothetical protein